MAATAPNLVLSTAWNMDAKAVMVFVDSLRNHFSGPVMMLVTSQGKSSAELIHYLVSEDITPIFFNCPFWMISQIQVGRYIRYQEILLGLREPVGKILLADSADVFFQADPFAQLPDGDLLCFLESDGRSIGDCKINSMWIQQVFGDAELARVKNFPISCSGTTIGSYSAILAYLHALLSQAQPAVLAKLRGLRGHDQGIHNFLLHTGGLPGARIVPNGEHIYTVGRIPDAQVGVDPQGQVVGPEGKICPVIHQYNYRPGLAEYFKTKLDGIEKRYAEGGQASA